MVGCLKTLGIGISVTADPDESANRTITIRGTGGILARGGSSDRPIELYVGNAGTAARFLADYEGKGDQLTIKVKKAKAPKEPKEKKSE